MLRLTVILSLFATSCATTGVDVSQAVGQSDWTCLQSPGGQGAIEFAIVRTYQSVGRVDPNAAATIKAARASGIKYVDGYIFPCVSCGDPAGQVRAAKNALDAAGADFGMLWYDIEAHSWSSSLASNQAFVKAMVDEGIALGIHAGVYTNWNSWAEIVGSSWSYPSAKGLPVWYPHYDGSASFSDFKTFGGWSKPNIKQYLGDKSSCGAGVDYNYYPSAEFAEMRRRQEHQPGSSQLPRQAFLQAHPNIDKPNVSSTGCSWTPYKQCDAKWKDEQLGASTSNTICSAGCAMSSVAMYLTSRGHAQTPSQLNTWLKGHSGYASGDLLVWASVDAFGVAFQSIETGVSVATLQSGLSACHGIIANVRNGQHWVLLIGYAGNDNFYVNDPGFNQATYPLSEMLRFAVYHDSGSTGITV